MPVQYKDLGKATKDLFEKNYEHGKYSLEVKSKGSGHEFTSKGHQDHATGDLSSSHEHKFKACKLGDLKCTFKPGSDKVSFDLENKSAVKDAKFNLLFNMGLGGCPVPNVESLKVNFSNPNINADLESNLGNRLKFAAVVDAAKLPFNIGFNGSFDLGKTALTSKEIAIHMNKGSLDYVFKTGLNNDISIALHNTINSDLVLHQHYPQKVCYQSSLSWSYESWMWCQQPI